MFYRTARILFVWSVLTAVVAACALAADAPPESNPPKAPAKQASPAAVPQPAPAGGVVVFKDPVTGAIRQPDASEIGELVGASAPTSRALIAVPTAIEIQGAGGVPGFLLGPDSHSYMVVTKTSDGKLAAECVTGHKAAEARVAAHPAPAPKEAPDVQ